MLVTTRKATYWSFPYFLREKPYKIQARSMLSYELILLNIFMEMSFIVFWGWIEGGWRHKSVGGVVRTYVQCTLYMYLLLYIRDVSQTFPITGIPTKTCYL